MKIMSWNILASEWIKKSYYPKVNKKILFNRKARFNKIMKTINQENADIIMLQEVMSLEYKSLKHYLDNKYTISPLNPIKWKYPKDNKTKNQGESGNVTFIRKNILKNDGIKNSNKEINHQSFDFGIYTQIPNNNISVFNIHLDDLSVTTRNKQMKSVESLLYTTPKCIIGGDFNQPYRKNSKIYNLPEFIIHNTNCPTYYIEEKMNIDNIMSRGFDKDKDKNKNKVENEEQCGIYPTTMEEGFEMYGSDHLPVIISI